MKYKCGLIIVVAAVLGCTSESSPRERSQAPMPRGFIWLEPSDRATSVGPSVAIRVGLNNAGVAVTKAVVDDIVANLVLSFDDLSTPIAFTAKHVPANPALHEPNPREFIEILPAAPLADRWHALRLKRVPAGFQLQSVFYNAFVDGSYGVRFRIGSEPVVRLIRTCPKAGSTLILADFSERVVGDALKLTLDYEDGTSGAACVPAALPPAGELAVEFSCSSSVDKSKRLRLQLTPVIKSVSGVPVGAGAVSFSLDKLLPLGDGCIGVRP